MSSEEKNSIPVDMFIIGGPEGLATAVGVIPRLFSTPANTEMKAPHTSTFSQLGTIKVPRKLEQQLDRILWTTRVPSVMWTPKTSRRSRLRVVSSKFRMIRGKAEVEKVWFWQREFTIYFQISKVIVIVRGKACKEIHRPFQKKHKLTRRN